MHSEENRRAASGRLLRIRRMIFLAICVTALPAYAEVCDKMPGGFDLGRTTSGAWLARVLELSVSPLALMLLGLAALALRFPKLRWPSAAAGLVTGLLALLSIVELLRDSHFLSSARREGCEEALFAPPLVQFILSMLLLASFIVTSRRQRETTA